MPRHIDFRQRASMPIRDMERDGLIVFWVDVYGVTGSDLAIIPGGSRPMLKAVERMGLDPNRYQALIWDTWQSRAHKAKNPDDNAAG